MAIIKSSIIHPSGTSGDFVYRQRNGKTVMYRRPVCQQVSQSPAAKSARSSFAINTKFAVYTNSFPYLMYTWRRAKVGGSNHFQKIIKNNAHLTKKYGLSAHNIITPPGITIFPEEVSLLPHGINIRISLSSEKLIDFLKQPYVLHIIFYFFEPVRKTSPPYCFAGIYNEIRQPLVENPYTIKLSFDEEIKAFIKKYKKTIIYLAASLTEPGNNKIFWTSTFSSEFSL
jgi:hypothetical protein